MGTKRRGNDPQHHHHHPLNTNGDIPGLNMSLSPDDPKAVTIKQHYYPEGGWGWVVCVCAVLIQVLAAGLHYAFGFFLLDVLRNFSSDSGILQAVCLGALSTTVALFLSPVVVAICRRKSTRFVAVLGGLITALGCLFTSFASQFHQLFLSYGAFVGCGVGLTRDTSTLMVGQYFKKKRELVEIAVLTGTGVGMAVMPLIITQSVRALGWRIGLQLTTGLLFLTFVLGIFYRPASLYHPQRRAILHLKSLQKRSKAKDKNASIEKPPFFDFRVLRSRTVQILMFGTAVAAFGINSPLILMVYEGRQEGLTHQSLLLLHAFLGIASALGSGAFGCIVVKNSMQCMIARQYLCQAASFMISASLLAFTTLEDYHGYLLFVWIYGIFYGGYNYSLKMFTLEKVRARNFPGAWGFVQWSQAIPNIIGIFLTGYINDLYGGKAGFYLSSAFTFVGTVSLFLIDVHKRHLRRRKQSLATMGRRPSDMCFSRSLSRRSSLQESVFGRQPPAAQIQQRSLTFSNYAELRRQQELTCISEEVMMDNFFEDFVLEDCITSCNKEEKYLMLSEYENNLNTSEDFSERDRAPSRRVGVYTAPRLEQCPNCRQCTASMATDSDSLRKDPSSFRTSLRHHVPNPICSIDVIEEVTTSL